MSTPTDGKLFSNIAATTAAFTLKGGNYNFAVVATFGGGNVQLQVLGPDGSTWLLAGTSVTVAGWQAIIGLAPGQYRIAVTTATAVFVTVAGIPD